MKILIVDDEEMIRNVLREYVEFEGGEVKEAADGMEAVAMCREEEFDAVVMDVMMPRLDGYSAVKEIRKFSSVPVLMLSARGEEYDKLFGFEIGSDDYVTKPFSPKELMLRVDAVLHRYHTTGTGQKEAAPGQIFQLEGLRIDLAARIVYVDGSRVELSPKEYDLLFYMLENKNIALSREKLITQVWGYDYYGDDRTLDTHIKLLRKSLGPYAKFIVTLRGVGYRFDTES